MRPDREMAIEVMRNMGWTAERSRKRGKPAWESRRAETGGLYDYVVRRQDHLSMTWVAEIAMRYGDAPDLVKEIAEAKERWLRSRFLGIFTRSETEA